MNIESIAFFSIFIKLVFLFLIAWLIVTVIKYLNSKMK